MEFRTHRIDIDGDTYTLRELSGLAVEEAQQCNGEMRQGYALIALSLVGPHGPLYPPDKLADGLAYVLGLPTRVSQQLTDAVAKLNFADLDDARKN